MNPDSSPASPSSENHFSPLLGDVLFLFGYVMASLAFLTVLRGMLLWSNIALAKLIPFEDLAHTFLLGLRFDLIVTCILVVPLVVVLLLPRGLGSRRLALLWLGLTGSLTIFAGVTELEFYREFHIRLNSIAFHYLQEDISTVVSMIWNGYPVVIYLLVWLFLTGIFLATLLWLDRSTPKQAATRYRAALRVPVVVLLLFLAVWGARGTLRSGPPLRWGDATNTRG
tara:strand:+ start:41979 stop:42656 length:678 start_codon:yes stop_codon:yes gene_type:complete